MLSNHNKKHNFAVPHGDLKFLASCSRNSRMALFIIHLALSTPFIQSMLLSMLIQMPAFSWTRISTNLWPRYHSKTTIRPQDTLESCKAFFNISRTVRLEPTIPARRRHLSPLEADKAMSRTLRLRIEKLDSGPQCR